MDSKKVLAAAGAPYKVPAGAFSINTTKTYFGLSEGKKPTTQEVMYSFLAPTCAVPVLPATRNQSKFKATAVQSSTDILIPSLTTSTFFGSRGMFLYAAFSPAINVGVNSLPPLAITPTLIAGEKAAYKNI